MNYKNIISIELNKRCGKPCIRGMRMTMEDVLENLAAGVTKDELLEEFPYLTRDDIFACLVYGADGEEISPRIRTLQFDLIMRKTPQERVAMAGEMFTAKRQAVLDSLPKSLSEKEIKEQLYFRTYGEHLPDDFFKQKLVVIN